MQGLQIKTKEEVLAETLIRIGAMVVLVGVFAMYLGASALVDMRRGPGPNRKKPAPKPRVKPTTVVTDINAAPSKRSKAA